MRISCKDKICMVYITAKDRCEANSIAEVIVREKLAACANIIEDISSFYFWEGKEYQEQEVLVLLKTTENNLPGIETRVKELHSYVCPCIIAFPIIYISEEYAFWVRSNVKKD